MVLFLFLKTDTTNYYTNKYFTYILLLYNICNSRDSNIEIKNQK